MSNQWPYTQQTDISDDWRKMSPVERVPHRAEGLDSASPVPTLPARPSSPYSGPIPLPEVLSGYNDVFPDGGHEVFLMAQEQMRHRHALERRDSLLRGIRSFCGLGAGFIVAVLGLTYAYQLGMAGHDAAAQWIGVADLVSLVGLFLAGQRSREYSLLDRFATILSNLGGEAKRSAPPTRA